VYRFLIRSSLLKSSGRSWGDCVGLGVNPFSLMMGVTVALGSFKASDDTTFGATERAARRKHKAMVA
jgi:hypothetical protein